MKKRLSVYLSCGLMLMASMGVVRGTIPANAISDPRYALGYLVVTNYSNIDPTGVKDSTVGLQTAINDSVANQLVVFLSPGTYTITNTLRCDNYELWTGGAGGGPNNPSYNTQRLKGSKLGASRPLIKLKTSSPGFTSTNDPRPMISFKMWRAANSSATAPATAPNAFDAPANFIEFGPDLFDCLLQNIDFDCNGNAGAVAVHYNGAQGCRMLDVSINAVGALAGIVGAPGGCGAVVNVKVNGGLYGLAMGEALSVSASGTTDIATFTGITLTNQTVASLVADNFSGPVELVGFLIKPAAGGWAVQNSAGFATSQGTYSLFDGTVDMSSNSGKVALTNVGVGRTVYLRNVYVTGTDNLVKSATQATVTGTGTWKLINEYCFTDQTTPAGDPPYETNDFGIRTFSVINGTVSRTPIEPVTSVQSSASAPPSDLISRHVYDDLPSIEDGTITDAVHGLGTFENPLDYGATPDADALGSADNVAFQTAIDNAHTAGHGRVVVPGGTFLLTNTLTIYGNSKFFGAASQVSTLRVADAWKTSTGSPFMVQTTDDVDATTFFGFMALHAKVFGGVPLADGAYKYDLFSQLLWQAGRHSMTLGWTAEADTPGTNVISHPKSNLYFKGHGGGRHWGFAGMGRQMDGNGTRVIVFDKTTEPTWMYMCNVEISKAGTSKYADANIAMTNTSNVRLIGMKREGHSPTIIMQNCTNIAIYGHETRIGISNIFIIQGTSTNILITTALARQVQGATNWGRFNYIHEAITGLSVLDTWWPEYISIYKRGEVNDAAVYISSGGSAPAAPSGLAATVISASQIDLDWVDNASDETGFRVKRSTTHLGPYSQVGSDQSAIGGTGGAGNYSDSNLVQNTTYYYVVSAFNGSGENTSSEVSGTTPAGTPAAPTGLNATALSYNQISLTWTDNANNETGFRLERKKGSGGTYAQIASLPANATSYGDSNNTGVATQYYYRIAATNAVGSSTVSTEDDATTSEITSGRVGHWQLDEGSGTTTTDASGNANTGILGTSPNTPVWTTTGKIGNALRFDGANDEVNVGHGTSLQLTSSTTWLGWIYLSNTVTTARDIISKRGGSTARGWSFYVEDSRLKAQVCDSANQANNVIRSNTTALASGQWYHVAGVYNATAQTLDVYINGSVNNGNLTLTGLAGVPAAQFDAPANDVYLGRKNAASEWWNGMLDDVRVYNRALNTSEIGACYNAGLP